MFGSGKDGPGVKGQSDTDNGVAGSSKHGLGVWGDSTDGFAAVHVHGGKNGVWGYTVSPNDAGVFGSNDGGGNGILGVSASPAGNKGAVVGVSNSNSLSSNAVLGISTTILGGSGAGNAIHGIGGTNAGLFDGHVQINGPLDVTGEFTCPQKHFVIDHPCDPANKYLYHSSVESFEMMNMYNGNVTTDGNGEAAVILPDYFDALNCDFCYQPSASLPRRLSQLRLQRTVFL